MKDQQKKKYRNYRIVWRFCEVAPFFLRYSYESPTFKIDNTDWCLKLTRPSEGNVKYQFTLCKIGETNVLKCSFYLLCANTNKCIKLNKNSPFVTKPTEFPHSDRDMTVVCAFDIDFGGHTSVKKHEYWLECKTQELRKYFHHPTAITSLPEMCSISIGNIQKKTVEMELARRDDGMYAKLHATGLDRKCHFLVAIWTSRGTYDTVCVGPTQIEYSSLESMATFIEVFAISYDFQKMSQDRISEITEFVKNSCSDSLQTVESVETTHFTKSLSTIDSISTSTTTAEQWTILHCQTHNKFCDITIHQVPGGHKIRAHKVVLVSGSTVWRGLLTNDDNVSIITTDLEKDVIEALVKFIYIGSVPEPPKRIDQLLSAADKYGVDGLKLWCERRLIDLITKDSVIHLLILAYANNASILYDIAINFIRQNISELKECEDWQSVFFTYPELALKLFNSLV